MRVCLVAASFLLLSGCGLITADRPDIQQGNVLKNSEISELRTGMSRARVRELIGTPVLQDRMHPNRWDYVYYRTQGGREVEQAQRLSLFFEGDRLARIDDRYQAPEPDPIETESGPLPEPQQPASPSEGPPEPEVPSPGPGGPGVP